VRLASGSLRDHNICHQALASNCKVLNFRVADFIRLVVPLVGRTGVLASGAVISQSILILSAPLLLRLYEPTSIGMLAAFIGLVSLLTIIACGRYDLAIPLAKHPSDATTLVALCLFLLLIHTLMQYVKDIVVKADYVVTNLTV